MILTDDKDVIFFHKRDFVDYCLIHANIKMLPELIQLEAQGDCSKHEYELLR